MNCHRVRQVVFLYADNELDQTVLVSFRQHLDDCPACAREAEYTVRWLTLVRTRCCRSRAPESLRDRIQRALFAQGETLG
jgi:mycothiol system anti-sigma-R factor